MAIGSYTKTTYVNGSAPAINATNLNNAENQIKEITDAAVSGGANPTKIWTSSNDGNGGQQPSPKPSTSPYGGSNAIGQTISGASISGFTIPGSASALWEFWVISHNIASNTIVPSETGFGQAPGGDVLACSSGNQIIYKVTRIS